MPSMPNQNTTRKKQYIISALVLLLLSITGCTGISAQQTLVADHALVGTQVSELAMTSTVERARLQITLDYVNTQPALLATQSQFLKATLVGNGTPLASLNDYQATVIQQPRIALPTASPTNNVDPNSEAQAGMPAPPPTADVTATPSPVPSPIITPAIALTQGALTAIAEATPVTGVNDVNASTLPAFVSDIRLGTSVGNDDCVGQATTTFNITTPEIYISARITDSPANTRFSTRWTAPDGNSVTFDFTPDFSIDDACIWFFIDQTDLSFIAGNWSVNFDVNNSGGGDDFAFNIVGN
jgi:hypothetical protein